MSIKQLSNWIICAGIFTVSQGKELVSDEVSSSLSGDCLLSMTQLLSLQACSVSYSVFKTDSLVENTTTKTYYQRQENSNGDTELELVECEQDDEDLCTDYHDEVVVTGKTIAKVRPS